MKQILSLVVLLVCCGQNLLADPQGKSWVRSQIEQWQKAHPGETMQNRICKPVEQHYDLLDYRNNDRFCETSEMRSVVRSIHSQYISVSNPTSCRALANRVATIQKQVDVLSINQAAAQIAMELTSLMKAQDAQVEQIDKLIHGTSGMAPGGLPCLQQRSELINYFNDDYEALQDLHKEAMKILKSVDKTL